MDFRDPRVREGLAVAPTAHAVIPPANFHNITIPLYWPGDEVLIGKWDMKEYVFKPRSVFKCGSKLKHQQNDNGHLLLNMDLEEDPVTGNPTHIAKALVDKYGHMGLIILGGDEDDVLRKKQARELKYNPWRLEDSEKLIARHRQACAIAMRNNTAAPRPPAGYEAALSFVRSQDQTVDGGGRFICQLDGTRYELRSQAWAHVQEIDPSQMGNENAVRDTMPLTPDPEVEAAKHGTSLPEAPARRFPAPIADAEPSELDALRAERNALYMQAIDEEIMVPSALRENLKSAEIEIVSIAMEELRQLLGKPVLAAQLS